MKQLQEAGVLEVIRATGNFKVIPGRENSITVRETNAQITTS